MRRREERKARERWRAPSGCEASGQVNTREHERAQVSRAGRTLVQLLLAEEPEVCGGPGGRGIYSISKRDLKRTASMRNDNAQPTTMATWQRRQIQKSG